MASKHPRDSTLVVANVGNTTTRVGLRRDDIVEEVGVAPTCEVGRVLEHLERLAAAEPAAGSEGLHIAFCSVVPEAEQVLADWIDRHGWAALVIRGDTESPLVNRYRDPVRLGGDRLAAAVGAVGRFGAPVLVVSLGTAAVMDAVSAESEFLGGAIAAGLRAGLSALAEKTRGLPFVEPASPAGPIAADTKECLRAGVVHGMAAWVEGMADRMRESMGAQAPLALTGGDAPLVSAHLRAEHHVIPTLTLEGIAAVWDHNRGRVRADR